MTTRQASGRGPGKRAGLDHDRIVAAALAVIDEHGVDGLTMRRLGTALDVAPMTIYSHFANRAAVIDAVTDQQAMRMYDIAGDLPTDPIDVLVAIALQFRRVLLEHPRLAPVLAVRPLPRHRGPLFVDIGAHLLRNAGFPDHDIPSVSEISTRFTIGCALQEAALREPGVQTAYRPEHERIVQRLARSELDTELAQSVVAYRLDDGPERATADFERGLRALLAGLLSSSRTPA